MKKDIVSMLPEELEQDFALLDEQKFRAKQVFQWLGRGVRDFDKISQSRCAKSSRANMSCTNRRSSASRSRPLMEQLSIYGNLRTETPSKQL